jgi:hypothetical protein
MYLLPKSKKGLKWCDIALLIWSPDAAASKWTEEEWTSVLHREVTEQRVRLGIIKLREHPLPELRTKNYVSAQSDPQAAIGDTLDWLNRRERRAAPLWTQSLRLSSRLPPAGLRRPHGTTRPSAQH